MFEILGEEYQISSGGSESWSTGKGCIKLSAKDGNMAQSQSCQEH